MLKISPDIKESYISEIVEIAINNDISAIILTNTTNGNRDMLTSSYKNEEGGLSGEPLQEASTKMIKNFIRNLKEEFQLSVLEV